MTAVCCLAPTATRVVGDVINAVSHWREIAKEVGVPRDLIDDIEPTLRLDLR